MANVYTKAGGNIAFDTAVTDSAYAAASDANKTAGAVQYSTAPYRIIGIKTLAANAETVTIREVATSGDPRSAGRVILSHYHETGQLNPYFSFGDGIWVSGIGLTAKGAAATSGATIYLA